MPPKQRPSHCGLDGCLQPLPTGHKYLYCCDEHAKEMRRKLDRERRVPLSTVPGTPKVQPVSDGYFCAGCKFIKACPGSARGVQCMAGVYRKCQPWTGAPALKVAR